MSNNNNNNNNMQDSNYNNNDNQRANQICEEYTALVERSHQLFIGLRELPQFGRQWLPYFQKAFEVYTKLWKFQQSHRNILENRERFGLRRWEIGEIASKIGQLYYHFYLRTSETNYLQEAFVFYEAIRVRGYFREVVELKQAALMVKKLRYYARFIVVAFLLNRKGLVKELADELHRHVEEYVRVFRPSDAQEWQFVIQEISLFLQADTSLQVAGRGNNFPLSFRLKTAPPPPPSSSSSSSLSFSSSSSSGSSSSSAPSASVSRPRLEEAIIIGNSQQQIKFSELTLDMFRMVQALERDPSSMADLDAEEKKRRRNPTKHLLYRPNFSTLQLFLTNSFKELPEHGILFLYISADGMKNLPNFQLGPKYAAGGITLNSKKTEAASTTQACSSCLYPDELSPFTRRPLFVVVDSDNSLSFKSLKSPFGTAVMILMSPQASPPDTEDPWLHTGNLFTFFLHDSLTAFSSLVGSTQISNETYDECTKIIEECFEAIKTLLLNVEKVDPAILFFAKDDFLLTFICRFVFCQVTLALHGKFQGKSDYLPQSSPELPPKVTYNHAVLSPVIQLASLLKVEDQFRNVLETPIE